VALSRLRYLDLSISRRMLPSFSFDVSYYEKKGEKKGMIGTRDARMKVPVEQFLISQLKGDVEIRIIH